MEIESNTQPRFIEATFFITSIIDIPAVEKKLNITWEEVSKFWVDGDTLFVQTKNFPHQTHSLEEVLDHYPPEYAKCSGVYELNINHERIEEQP